MQRPFRLLRLCRVPGFQPCPESAEKGIYVFETVVEEDLRRTGARSFLMSGAVGHDDLVVWQLREVLFQIGVMDA